MNVFGPGIFLVGRLFVTHSVLDLIIGLFLSLISFLLNLGRLNVSRTLSISSRFSSLCT